MFFNVSVRVYNCEKVLVLQIMFGRSTTTFDRLLEKSTSQLLLEPDWTSTLMLCDTIRQGDVSAKYAVSAIKKKFYHSNPHVALYALQVMGIVVAVSTHILHGVHAVLLQVVVVLQRPSTQNINKSGLFSCPYRILDYFSDILFTFLTTFILITKLKSMSFYLSFLSV